MRFRVLKRSRSRRAVGDLFVFSFSAGEFYFGRVVSNDSGVAGFGGANLLYFYKGASRSPDDVPKRMLAPDDLLCPPMATNDVPWRQGYFQTVRNQPLGSGERLDVHCFRSSLSGQYFDEDDRELDGPVGLVGDAALWTCKGLDEELFDLVTR